MPGILYCFTRRDTTKPFMPNCDDQFVMPSPAFDDAYTTIYYNCGTGMLRTPVQSCGRLSSMPGDLEEHVAMGPPSGSFDPWVEPGGNTILFAAEHSLFRATRVCN